MLDIKEMSGKGGVEETVAELLDEYMPCHIFVVAFSETMPVKVMISGDVDFMKLADFLEMLAAEYREHARNSLS